MNYKLKVFSKFNLNKLCQHTIAVLITSFLLSSPTFAKSKQCQEFYTKSEPILKSSTIKSNQLKASSNKFSSADPSLLNQKNSLDRDLEEAIGKMREVLEHAQQKAENKNPLKYIGATCKKDNDQFNAAYSSFQASANNYEALIKKLGSEKEKQEAEARAAAEKAKQEAEARAAASPELLALLEKVKKAQTINDLDRDDKLKIVKLKRNIQNEVEQEIVTRFNTLAEKIKQEKFQQAQEKLQQKLLNKQQEEAIIKSRENDATIAQKIRNKQPLTDLERKRVKEIMMGSSNIETPDEEYIVENAPLD